MNVIAPTPPFLSQMPPLPSSLSRPANASDLIRLQREATIARQEAAESAEAYAQARDENTDLITQLTDSNAAYDRMAEQLERTAQDLQSLLSGAVSVAVADAQKRASTAEQEVAALRVELKNARTVVRSRSQSPDRQFRLCSRANSPASRAISPTSSSSPLGLQSVIPPTSAAYGSACREKQCFREHAPYAQVLTSIMNKRYLNIMPLSMYFQNHW